MSESDIITRLDRIEAMLKALTESARSASPRVGDWIAVKEQASRSEFYDIGEVTEIYGNWCWVQFLGADKRLVNIPRLQSTGLFAPTRDLLRERLQKHA